MSIWFLRLGSFYTVSQRINSCICWSAYNRLIRNWIACTTEFYDRLLRRDLRRIIVATANNLWQDAWQVSWWEWCQSLSQHLIETGRVLTFLGKMARAPTQSTALGYSWWDIPIIICFVSNNTFRCEAGEEVLLSTYARLASLSPFVLKGRQCVQYPW